MPDLPHELLAADAALHAILAEIRFSNHLNPSNIPAARAAFFAGAEAPPFVYAPTPWADDALAALSALRPPTEHPLGRVVADAILETATLIQALQRRDAETFFRLAEVCDWLPDPSDDREIPAAPPTGVVAAQIGAERMYTALRDALRARGMHDWTVEWERVLASRVLVDAVRRVIRVNPASRFNELDRAGLVAHEVDVHAVRAANGARQPLSVFATGLPRSLLTEEGLAITAEEEVRGIWPGFEARQRVVARAIHLAQRCGFRALWEALTPNTGPNTAFGIALRVKRGLSRPDLPGVYAKDSVYLRGWRRTRAWIADGGDLALLYVGKVGLEHPVAEWLDRGWIQPGPTPRLWHRVQERGGA